MIDKTILLGEGIRGASPQGTRAQSMYHCGTPPVLMHIGTGMYGAMIVDPKDGYPRPRS